MKSRSQNRNNEIPSRFTFHEDAGHGWLEVPYNAIVALEIQDKVTGFSYRKDNTVYLEEDSDATLFIKALLVHIGKNKDDFEYFKSICHTVYDGDSSPIRNYASYR